MPRVRRARRYQFGGATRFLAEIDASARIDHRIQ